MSSAKDTINKTSNFIKYYTNKKSKSIKIRNNFIGYSEQSSNDITNNNNPISLKSNFKPSMTSMLSNKKSTESSSINAYLEQKFNKKNPSLIFPKSLFTSIDDNSKVDMSRNQNLDKSYLRNKSINNLHHNSNFRTSNHGENLNQLLKKLSSTRSKIKSLDKEIKKIKFEKLKIRQNKNKVSEQNINPKKKFSHLYFFNRNKNKNKGNYPNINKQNKMYLFKGKKFFSQYKEYKTHMRKLPNISVEENNKYNNISVKNIKTDIYMKTPKKKNMSKENIITPIIYKRKKININNSEYREFINKIKNKQLFNLLRRFKLSERRNKLNELSLYKNNIFPIETIKLLVSKRNELTIDKFRNEYINKLGKITLKYNNLNNSHDSYENLYD